MKNKILVTFLLILSFSYAHASEDVGYLSPEEKNHCRKAGCFSQGVATNWNILEVQAEVIHVNKEGQKYVTFLVTAKAGDLENEFSITQWIGTEKYTNQEYLQNARNFAKALEKIRQAGKKLNLVSWGHVNNMTAKWPLLGYFTNDGESFFQDRVSVPLFTTY